MALLLNLVGLLKRMTKQWHMFNFNCQETVLFTQIPEACDELPNKMCASCFLDSFVSTMSGRKDFKLF